MDAKMAEQERQQRTAATVKTGRAPGKLGEALSWHRSCTSPAVPALGPPSSSSCLTSLPAPPPYYDGTYALPRPAESRAGERREALRTPYAASAAALKCNIEVR
eukprot:scaffold25788_cov143-Isochrysis_galbana.AAC.2